MASALSNNSAVLRAAIQDYIRLYPAKHYYVAYSGGLDSAVLLHLLSQLVDAADISPLHVHHGLLPEADGWVEHCLQFSQQLGLNCKVHFANLAGSTVKAEQGLEALARDARYAYFHSLLQSDSVLLTAHHADDQAETFMLNALRGSGVNGLAAMPVIKAFGEAVHIRPFLAFSREQLSEYAVEHKLSWVEDPSNKDDRFNRNYLRQHIMPLLQQRWPSVADTLSRSASLMSDSLELHTALAEIDCQVIESKEVLAISRLAELSLVRRLNALRYWLQLNQVLLPSKAVLQELDTAMFAEEDANPEIVIGDFVIRRFQESLYCCKDEVLDTSKSYNWDLQTDLVLEDGFRLQPSILGDLLELLMSANANVQVSYRKGGERIQLKGRDHKHQLKKLLQEKAVPTWLREQVPLVFYQDQLIAVISPGFTILGEIENL